MPAGVHQARDQERRALQRPAIGRQPVRADSSQLRRSLCVMSRRTYLQLRIPNRWTPLPPNVNAGESANWLAIAGRGAVSRQRHTDR